jgi:hypothetical protein
MLVYQIAILRPRRSGMGCKAFAVVFAGTLMAQAPRQLGHIRAHRFSHFRTS